MRLALVLCASAVLLVGSAPAQEGEVTEYSLPEIDQFLASFKRDAKNKKVPQEDANTAVLELVKAYKFLESKGEAATKDEQKYMSKIVKMLASGLKLRRRELVTLECAKALGDCGHKDAAKPLVSWMDRTVLDAKSVNPNWVEYGFMAMAKVGDQSSKSIDLVVKYASGGHVDQIVTPQAMKAAYHWRTLNPKNRKLLFEKILGYLSGRWSGWKGGDPKKRGTYEKQYNSCKEDGLKALWQLSGYKEGFANPPAAQDWWKDNKKKKWEPYVGVGFRAKAAKGAKGDDKKKDDKKKDEKKKDGKAE